MTKLFLDDIRIPTSSVFTIVRSYNAAIEFMEENGCPEFISFDHDLGDADKHSGMDVAKWLVEKDLDADGGFIPKDFTFDVHSSNPPGSANIVCLLDLYLGQR